MNSSILNQEDGLEISETPANTDSSTIALNDSLRHLRLRHYQQEPLNWLSETPEEQEAVPQEQALAEPPLQQAEQRQPTTPAGAQESGALLSNETALDTGWNDALAHLSTHNAPIQWLSATPPAQEETAPPPQEETAETKVAEAAFAPVEPLLQVESEEAQAEEAAETTPSAGWDDALKHLRLRRFQQETADWLVEPEPAAEEQTQEQAEAEEEAALLPADQADTSDEPDEEEQDYDLSAAIDELGQEIRRVGRELFKTNRTVEHNQETFEEALTELRQLSTAVAQVSAHQAAPLNDAKFEAKAAICRELLRLADTLEASLSAANELVARLRNTANHSTLGAAFYFAATRELHSSFNEAVAALGQWRDGQRLLVERLHAILQTAGVRAVETKSRTFDPAQHRAVSVAQRTDVAPNTIVGEELRGYTLDGRILRYSEVIVARHE